MNIFLQKIGYFSEGKHDPENEEHRFKLLDVDHSNISKDKGHEHYEDKIHNAVKGLKSEVHGKDTVKKYLEKHNNTLILSKDIIMGVETKVFDTTLNKIC